MGTTLVAAVGDVLVIVHTEKAPTDAEWDHVLTCLTGVPELRGAFVMTDGGMPNAEQRTRLGAATTRPYRSAVLSQSKLAHIVSKAISWFGINIRVFPIGAHWDALKFLKVPQTDHEPILEKAAELRVRLAGMSSLEDARQLLHLDTELVLQHVLKQPISSLAAARRSGTG